MSKLYKNLEKSFDIVWYDSLIPDFGDAGIIKAMDMVHPEQDDDEATLLAKAYLLWGIANTLPESRNFTAQKVAEVQNLIFSEEH